MVLQRDSRYCNFARVWEEPHGSSPVVNMTVCLRDTERDDVRGIPIVCAVTDLRAAEYDVILPADVVRELQASSVAVNV